MAVSFLPILENLDDHTMCDEIGFPVVDKCPLHDYGHQSGPVWSRLPQGTSKDYFFEILGHSESHLRGYCRNISPIPVVVSMR